MRESGKYENLGNIRFFVPNPLPPENPPLNLDSEMMTIYGEAMLQIGELKRITKKLPNKKGFIKAYVNKEALLSSEIEGINTTLLDVYTQPILKTQPDKNTQLVLNYTKAIYKALMLIKEENLPISSRVICGAHKELMQIGAGDKADPGNYRKQMVTVGNLVPPAANKIPELMYELEKYINTNESSPPLIKAGLAHVQFETIHPFLDGNGRIGRLLIVLMLIESGLLSEPILYPSYYFKKRRYEYYQFLDAVRTKGDFETWIKYYLTVIRDSGIDACMRAKDIEALNDDVVKRITNQETGKVSETKLKAVSIFFRFPVINVKKLSVQLDVSYNTASKIISDFMDTKNNSQKNKQK